MTKYLRLMYPIFQLNTSLILKSISNFLKSRKSTHKIKLTNKIYVEREDVRLDDHKEFLGMAPGKLVGLKYGFGL